MPLPLSTVNQWMRDGTTWFEAAVDTLDESDIRGESLLSGWTRGHVIAHIGRNADALVNLLTWAATGVETPMYASQEQRDADIELDATLPADELLTRMHAAHARLATAVEDLPEASWSARVRTRGNRDIAATEIPWLRTREVWIHAVDLGTGATTDEFPPELVDALLDDVVGAFGDAPAVQLAPTDRTRGWALTGAADPTTVTGSAAHLFAWLIGRSDGASLRSAPGPLPTLPAWL